MKIVYFGTAAFAVPALRAVAGSVLAVVTQPDRPTGRGLKTACSPVALAAQELGLPVLKPVKASDPEFIGQIKAMGPDALLVAAYGQILRTSLLETAKYGGINLHGSLLPKYRGAAPIQRCLLAGDTVTGVTLMQMDKGMDTGDEIARIETGIGPDETAQALTSRLAEMAAGLAADWMPKICKGEYTRQPQDHAMATMAPKVEKHEARLDPRGRADQEYNRFRAFTPSPGATLQTAFGPLKIYAASRSDLASPGPGIVAATRPLLVVGFADGCLGLDKVAPQGKASMSGADFANGKRLVVGTDIVAGVS